MLTQIEFYVSLAIEQRKVKEQVPAAMPQCFENWCRRFDDVFSRQKQRQEFRVYLGGLLGESQRKNRAPGCYEYSGEFVQQPATFPE